LAPCTKKKAIVVRLWFSRKSSVSRHCFSSAKEISSSAVFRLIPCFFKLALGVKAALRLSFGPAFGMLQTARSAVRDQTSLLFLSSLRLLFVSAAYYCLISARTLVGYVGRARPALPRGFGEVREESSGSQPFCPPSTSRPESCT
jgi:hypothetical protein